MTTPVFKRILLKLSGEALAATQGFGVDPFRIHEIAAELADVRSLGIEIAIVVGVRGQRDVVEKPIVEAGRDFAGEGADEERERPLREDCERSRRREFLPGRGRASQRDGPGFR